MYSFFDKSLGVQFDYCKIKDRTYWARGVMGVCEFVKLNSAGDVVIYVGKVDLVFLDQLVRNIFSFKAERKVWLISEHDVDFQYCNSLYKLLWLGSMPPNVLDPVGFEHVSTELLKDLEITIEIWDRRRLDEVGLNLISAVGGDSARLMRVSSNHAKGPADVALVGKAVTFDSGGLNLKKDRMHDMKFDMMGGAYALTLFSYLKSVDPAISVDLWIPIVDNLITADSIKPGSVIRSYNSKTIEVVNTDAEGRLLLADVLGFVSDRYRPRVIVDFATLTSSSRDFFGKIICPYFTTSDSFERTISDKGGNKFIRLPIDNRYLRYGKSAVADYSNISSLRSDAMYSSVFLAQFVDGVDWVHFDIAGVGFDSGYASGFGFAEFAKIIRSL